MRRNARDKRPHLKPVEKIQLSGENIPRRAVAAVVCLVLGAAALGCAVSQLFSTEPGWQAIEADSPDGPTCGSEFTLLYELGAEGRDAAAENRPLVQVYTEACRTAYQLFNADEGFEGVVNLWEINRHPNEVLQVDAALYHCFRTVQAFENRTLYLGPVTARYDDLFYCVDDAQLVDFDPRLSPEVAEEYAAVAAYAMDPAEIDLELLEDFQIRLRVSEDYLAYARREGIDRFLDFGWMKNAFITDYLSSKLIGAGFTRGTISSCDGFAQCLDDRELTYAVDLYDEADGRPIQVGTLEYQGRAAFVSLRSFPVAAGDERRYYRLKSGEVRTLYLDPADGLCKSSADSMVCCSMYWGCGEMALAAAPVFIADEPDLSGLRELTKDVGIVLCRDGQIQQTAAANFELAVKNLREGYTLVHASP